jgi:hypothetical protein
MTHFSTTEQWLFDILRQEVSSDEQDQRQKPRSNAGAEDTFYDNFMTFVDYRRDPDSPLANKLKVRVLKGNRFSLSGASL